MTLFYPWHLPNWQRLQGLVAENRLPHGLLLSGPQGSGKLEFAIHLSGALLCTARDPEGFACGSCRACETLNAGSHPDLFMVTPEEDAKVIKVEQIRKLVAQLALTSSQASGRRVAIIHPADAMNRNAANSLLKTLEEPPPDTVLMLITHSPAALPQTVRSRCQAINLEGEAQVKCQWLQSRIGTDLPAAVALQLANGGPLLAIALHQEGLFRERLQVLQELKALADGKLDPIAVAARWSALQAQTALRLLIGLVQDLALSQLPGAAGFLRNTDLACALRETAERLDLAALLTAKAMLDHHWRTLAGPGNIRAQDLFEEFAINWVDGYAQ